MGAGHTGGVGLVRGRPVRAARLSCVLPLLLAPHLPPSVLSQVTLPCPPPLLSRRNAGLSHLERSAASLEASLDAPAPADSEGPAGVLASLLSSPDVSWFKGHQPVSARTGVTISADGRGLHIERARLSDAGSYRCVASNVAGSTELHYGLRVDGELPWGHWGLFRETVFPSACLLLCPCIHSFLNSSTHPSTHPPVYLPTHSLIHPFTHPSTHLFIHHPSI